MREILPFDLSTLLLEQHSLRDNVMFISAHIEGVSVLNIATGIIQKPKRTFRPREDVK